MSVAPTESGYYNKHAASVSLDHPLAPVWRQAAAWLHDADPVYDLGCGTAGLGIARTEREAKGHYTGVDFSRASVELAQLAVAPATWFVADLRDEPPWLPEEIPGNAQFAATEVLEHLEADLAMIERWIPPGHRFIFSVPNYGSESHQRHFRSPGEAYKRYSPLLHFTAWRLFDLSPPRGRAVHLFDTIRRSDTWR